MTTYLGKSCSFCLPRVPFVNCRQFMYLVISLLVLRAGYGIWLYQFLIIAYLFTLRIKFYSQNTNLLRPTFRHLKQGIQDFHRRYVLVPADKAANNEEETSVVNGHCNHLDLKFSLCVKERQYRLPTMYWLPKLHRRPYKARFIANSYSCTTTKLPKLLTSCLTAVKNHVIRYCEKVYERSSKKLFWSIKDSGEVLNKLKPRGFPATSLSTYDFSTLYTALPHNLIKEKFINLIELLKGKVHLILPVTKGRFSSLLETQNDIHFGLVKTCANPLDNIYIRFGTKYTDKLLVFRWVLIMLLL